ncbi:hypothetical protein LARI1_G007316 [Lachnellula arida]|uniref:TauD/TfdA-like domain-containing protein n=1 Tax=Lachnellula arida TaxID=1316785 RepID=A0A8T9B191_9HELO|nr:hypothetical protein LARI1_G007316 [Lachnellula arida]
MPPSEALLRAPLTYSHTLDKYESFDVTGPIGREFPKLQLSELLKDDAKIKDLAILASQRGALFFRGQDISNDQMKDLGSKLGELTNKPPDSKLHRHALSSKDNAKNHDENGKTDEEVFFVSSVREKENHSNRFNAPLPKLASYLWHSDISFEHIPADYGVLKMAEMRTTLVETRSLPARTRCTTKLCDGLTATHFQVSELYSRSSPPSTTTDSLFLQPVFSRVLQQSKDPLITENRGHPENTGLEFSATQYG